MNSDEISGPIDGEDRTSREERSITLPWGGDPETAEMLSLFRGLAMHDPRLMALGGYADDPNAPFEVRVTWAFDDNGAVPVEVALRSRTVNPVTGQDWRSVRVAEAIDWSRTALGWTGTEAAKRLRERERHTAAEQAESAVAGLVRKRRAGRPPSFPHEHFEEVASVYLAAKASGSRTAVQEVAAYMEHHHPGDDRYTNATKGGDTRTKGWINRARQLGLIPTREQG